MRSAKPGTWGKWVAASVAVVVALAAAPAGAAWSPVLLDGPFELGTGNYWLVGNGGFEDAVPGDPTTPIGWTGQSYMLKRTTVDPFMGSASLEGTYQGGSAGSLVPAPTVFDGTQWVLSGYVYNELSSGNAKMDLDDHDPMTGVRPASDPTITVTSSREHYRFAYVVFDTAAGVSANGRPYLEGMASGTTGFARFDEVALTPLSEFRLPELAANKLHNPGFEQTIGTAAADWNMGSGFSSDATMAHSGNRSLKHIGSGWVNSNVKMVPTITPGTRYVLSGWMYKEPGAGGYIDVHDLQGDPNLGVGVTNQWAYASHVWTPQPGDPKLGQFDVRCVGGGSDTAAMWFDDISFIEYPEGQNGFGQNRISNASFEVLDGSSVYEWNAPKTNFIIDFDEAHDGDKSLKWVHTAGYNGGDVRTTGQTIPVEEGAEYLFSGWIKNALTNGSAYLDLGDVPGDVHLHGPATGEWTYLEGRWFAPAGVSELSVRAVVDGAPQGGNAWFDDVRFSRVPEPTTLALLAGGVGVLVRRRRRRQR